jgi:hypothetical protein
MKVNNVCIDPEYGSSINLGEISGDNAAYLREVLTYDHDEQLHVLRKALEIIIAANKEKQEKDSQ